MEDLRPPDPEETREWIEALDAVVERQGPDRARSLLEDLLRHAGRKSIAPDLLLSTPYVNTIPVSEEPPYPGDEDLEKRIRAIVRWNAVVMVLRAGRVVPNIGGHLATYASAATLFEVGFNHFFRARRDGAGGDQVYFQGHASPGIYARAFLEGRLTEGHLEHWGPVVAVSDYLRAVPDQIARWLPGRFFSLGTDGFGRSDDRAALRRHFEVTAEHVAYTVLNRLALEEQVPRPDLSRALHDLGIDPDHPNPALL
jgi:pyruvate dehydrogenase complex dehydrogenase (E1) component